MLLKEIKSIFHKELDPIYERGEVDSFFNLLTEHYLGLERFVLTINPRLVISKDEEQPLFQALSDLKLNRPIQHIIGKAHFMDMDFYVNENVLIPRPETEDLVRWIIEKYRIGSSHPIREESNTGLKILDIGTGSGCIAIALAKHLPNAEIFALDISKKALEITSKNAMDNKVELKIIESDILVLQKWEVKFDVIVSNPPYVRELERRNMSANVKEFEPNSALFVSNENPLLFYKAISCFAQENLVPGGHLFFEINQYLGKEMKLLLKDHNFKDIELHKDLFGNDRLTMARLNK